MFEIKGKLLWVVLLFLAGALAWNGDMRVDPHFPAFVNFMAKFDKNINEEDIFYKFQNFKTNLRQIERLNARNSTAAFGITKFSDMSVDEFRNFPCGGLLAEEGFGDNITSISRVVKHTNKQLLPKNWDWGKHGAVTSVKNQGVCGSCWAFSTMGNVEGVWAVSKNQLVKLAEQQLIDCSVSNYGCQGGWPAAAMKDLTTGLLEGRVDTEYGYPYAGYTQQCRFNPTTIGAVVKDFTVYCSPSTRSCHESQMKTLLYKVGPLSVCIDATILQNYESGILDPEEGDCNPYYLDHCMLLTGYGEENGVRYWKLKNSWGSEYGEQGYVRIKRGVGACGINRAVSSVVV